jgi:hypothetical protein|tara:strand:+ start:60 stop:251 length:192 start_codon:yes stop_codon:yes gene_type:complete
MEKIYDKIGGRKMFLALILAILVTIFLLIEKCNFDQWSNFIIWIFGTYAVGNSVEHLSSVMKK